MVFRSRPAPRAFVRESSTHANNQFDPAQSRDSDDRRPSRRQAAHPNVSDNGGPPPRPTSDYFGINTFGWRQMRSKLPKEVYGKLLDSVRHGKKLDREIAADGRARDQGMGDLARGDALHATGSSRMTGLTAEKHDAFIVARRSTCRRSRSSPAPSSCRASPTRSSFPSGGMRTTFEARGYTAWDPSSPMFIVETGGARTLCIPSVFVSYHGDALDDKTPLLRSMRVLSKKATALLKLLGDIGVKRVSATLGPEQEYFLIDRNAFSRSAPTSS